MTNDYMNMGPALIVMDHYLRQTIEVAGEYMDSLRKLEVFEQIGLDTSQIEYAYRVPVLCELEAARCLVGQAYTYRLIDVEDFHTINRMLNRFGMTAKQEVKNEPDQARIAGCCPGFLSHYSYYYRRRRGFPEAGRRPG